MFTINNGKFNISIKQYIIKDPINITKIYRLNHFFYRATSYSFLKLVSSAKN